MSTIIKCGRELIRISPNNSKNLEYSTNKGRSWSTRYDGVSNVGEFRDLCHIGKEILGVTNKGIVCSSSTGKEWSVRYHTNPFIGEFLELCSLGKKILVTTTKAVCSSTNEGRAWIVQERM